jgi:hypothetical protein
MAAWSPNGERLLTVDGQGVFVIWDAGRGYAEERLRVLSERDADEPTQSSMREKPRSAVPAR